MHTQYALSCVKALPHPLRQKAVLFCPRYPVTPLLYSDVLANHLKHTHVQKHTTETKAAVAKPRPEVVAHFCPVSAPT